MDMGDVAASLNTSLDVVHLTITLFVAGFGIGPLFFAPLSEIFGRKPIIFVSMGKSPLLTDTLYLSSYEE